MMAVVTRRPDRLVAGDRAMVPRSVDCGILGGPLGRWRLREPSQRAGGPLRGDLEDAKPVRPGLAGAGRKRGRLPRLGSGTKPVLLLRIHCG